MNPTEAATREQAVRARLATVADPAGLGDIVAAGRVESVRLDGPVAHLTLRVPRGLAQAALQLQRAVETALNGTHGIAECRIVLTAHRDADAPPAPRGRYLAHIPHVIAVASGKGGVGKSTTAVNLAVALAQGGRRVGLLDADIHGPSLPIMLGTAARPVVRDERIQPIEAWGLATMSIGFMVNQDEAMIWRGPMVMSALNRMLGQVEWGSLDAMVIDLPPGTGDAHLTLVQQTALSGAVIVSTPQDVALLDARRGARMFEKTGVQVLGLIENMSYFCCPACNARTDIFGHGGARTQAGELGVPFLGEIPLLPAIRAAADNGTPITAAAPGSPAAEAYRAVAERITAALVG